MRSPRALPDRRLTTQTGEVILVRTLIRGGGGGGPPWGRARAKMVLGTFAETKVPRRAGAKPRI